MQPQSNRRRSGSWSAVVLSCTAALLVFAAPASAGHIKGGSISAALGADQHLTGHVEFIYRAAGACPAAPSQLAGTVQVTGPAGFSAAPPITNVAMTACLPSTKTEGGDYDLDLSGAADGTYTVTYGTCCRVTPIANVSGGAAGSTSYTATIHKAGASVTATPLLTSNVALGISTHAAYEQNLSATSPGGGALTYLLLQSTTPAQPDYDATAPTTNIVSLDGSGHVSIPSSTTSGLTAGTYYVYKVRVTNAAGDSAEREILLTVSNNNVPALVGPSSPVTVTAGATATLQFTATDPDGGQLVTILPAGLPAWAAVSATAGNPAAATVTLTPPAGTAEQDIAVNVDATDDDSAAPMTDSRTVTLHVAPPQAAPPSEETDATPPPAPTLLGVPSPRTTATSATITFSGEPGATFACRLDGGEWAPCVSPQRYAGLALGPHSIAVRQADAAGNTSSAATAAWTVTRPEPPPAARRLAVQAPAAIVTASDRPSVGCRAIGGSLTSCTVRAYARVTARRGRSQRVLVGRGRTGAVAAGRSRPVRLTLTRGGRRLLSRTGGVSVELRIAGRAAAGTTLRASHRVRLLPKQSRIVTSSGLFGSDSASMSPSGRRSLMRLARKLRHAKTVACTGYADSTGSSAYNAQLALARARAVCGLLRASRRAISVRVRGAGENRPAASNRTAAGRAQNRRVVVRVRYG